MPFSRSSSAFHNVILHKAAPAALSVLCTMHLCCVSFPETAAASSAQTDDTLYSLSFQPNISYSRYYDTYCSSLNPDTEILLSGADFCGTEGGTISAGDFGGKTDVCIWESLDGTVSYDFDVAETGNYSIEMLYYAMESTANQSEFSLMIDGELPFASAARICLNKIYVNKTEIRTDTRGNQIRPAQTEKPAWQTQFLYDKDGLFNTPLIFHLEKGHHTITLKGIKAALGIGSIRICQPDSNIRSETPDPSALENTPSALLRLEGESAACKSASTLYPGYDHSSYTVSPSDPVKMVYNTIGGANWNQAGQSITWEIAANALPGDGWYKIGIKARQDTMRGLYSNRRILIDGEIPNTACSQVKFYYDSSWNLTTVSDGEEPAYVYLTANEAHTLTMEVMPGEIGEYMRRLEDVVTDLNTCYKQILMITGPNPDKYNDYYVEESIPTLISDFQRLSEALKEAQNGIETLSGSLGSEAAALQRMYVILDKCIKKPSRIPSYVSQIKDHISTISTFICDYRNQPLEIDYIELASPDRSFSSIKSNPLKQLAFQCKAFAGSFTEDYTTLSDVDPEEENVISVWVNLGRDQALAVKDLVENEYAVAHPDTPIAVNLVVGGVVEASLAGEGPDVALFLGGEFPVNLACRGLLADLSQFPDYQQQMTDYHPEAAVQYSYNGGVYGMPLTQSWTMMFYRSDILTELGYTELPRTWDDLIDMLPALQRNHLGMGLILPSTNVAASTEPGHTFASLLLQRGLNYYNDAQTRTQFDAVPAIQCFEKWTDFYSDYRFMQTYDAYSYFRTGQYPIVIANYSFCNQLSVAAPEIKGLWDFTVMPGTVQEDGTINHASNSGGTGAVIFNKVKNKDAAWEFVKWFCSAEVQAEYGAKLEGLLGQMGRYEAASTKALAQLNWSAEEQNLLMAQWQSLKEIPVLPSSYAVTRNIMNAFRETVNSNENPRDTLMYYNCDMNEEIQRKRENLGLKNEKD
ncbi:MAG: extracellular solute-binding protein [Oscillospiraceae bacterium]|nr:extracellular solute-binding protein [Oscillospiraceae bacterium]